MRSLFKVTLLALAVSSAAHAVEFKPGDTVPSAGAVVQQVSANDPAIAVVTQLQAASAASALEKDAKDLADEFLARGGVTEGWNTDKKIYVAVSEAIFDSEDPSYDDSFIIKRSLKSMEAALDAKRTIIEYIHTDMSASDRVSTPGTDLNTEFKDKLDQLERKAESQRKQIAKLMETMDAQEAEMLHGVTFGDRANALMDAAIKKIDAGFNSGAIAAEKKVSFDRAKNNYQSAMTDHETTMNELNALAGSVTGESYSMVEAVAKMPLFGAVTTAQFESWDPDRQQYKVAMITIWSPKQEEMVRAMITGEAKTAPQGRQSLIEYLNGQDWSTATGGRKFRDNQGNFYILGVAASPVGSSSSSERKARGVAELMARKEVATALYADVASQQKAEQAMATMSGGAGKDVSVAAESFSSELAQSIENRAVQGLSRRFGRRVTHPISGQDIYVSIYSIDAGSIANAKIMKASQYQTKALDVQSQQEIKGAQAGYEQAIQKTENNRTAFNNAKVAAADSVQVSTAPEKSRPVQQQAPAKTNQSGAGSYSGGGNADASDAFGW